MDKRKPQLTCSQDKIDEVEDRLSEKSYKTRQNLSNEIILKDTDLSQFQSNDSSTNQIMDEDDENLEAYFG